MVVPVTVVRPEMPLGVSRVHRDPRSAGKGDGEIFRSIVPSVPIMVPSMVAPAQAGKQLAGPVTVPVMRPVTAPDVGRVTTSVAVNMPLKLPVIGILFPTVMLPFDEVVVEMMVPTKVPTMLTDPGFGMGP